MLKRPDNTDELALAQQQLSHPEADVESDLHSDSHISFEEDQLEEDEYEDDDSEDSEDDDSDEDDEEESGSWLDGETKGFLISLSVHIALILMLATIPIIADPETLATLIQSVPIEEEPEAEFDIVEDIAYSETINEEIGANSVSGTSIAMSEAPVVADVSEISSTSVSDISSPTMIDATMNIKQAVGLVESKQAVRGMTGVGTTGTEGAVDRITYEILRSMEERPTLVVWLFDASGSLTRRRQEIRDRFSKIYEELGIVQKMKDAKDERDGKPPKPTKEELEDEILLTSIYSFGAKIDQLTDRPTADLQEIMSRIDSIKTDTSGIEKTFSALYMAANEYKGYRANRDGNGPKRNVLLVAVTDERGDDNVGLEKTIDTCRKYAMPVYVMGVPAPFGREFSYIKYVDPDPKYDQSPQWAQIDQGPETYYPERIQLGYEDNYFEEPVMDSGFGPYALSRLCYETGGIYFTVHPNRKFGQKVSRQDTDAFASHLSYFFNPEIMDRYRPDYLPESEYMKNAQKSPMRQALLQASRFSRTGVLDKPRTEFIKRDEPSFVNDLTKSQQEAARLEPKLYSLCDMLLEGQKSRDKELSPRWLASFDLSFGTALAEKVRTETYNLMLAKAKRGIPFTKEKNNTWRLKPSNEISVGSKLEKEAKTAIDLLERVAKEHEGTPWGLLAQRELERPIGWTWEESFTDLAPKPPAPRNPANPPPPRVNAPGNEQAKMLAKPEMRPIPKL